MNCYYSILDLLSEWSEIDRYLDTELIFLYLKFYDNFAYRTVKSTMSKLNKEGLVKRRKGRYGRYEYTI